MINRKFSFLVLFFTVMVFFGPANILAENNSVVAILRSKDILPYNNAIRGFQEELIKDHKISFEEYTLENFNDSLDQLANQVNLNKPILIYAVGTEASLFAKNQFNETAVVFSMVLNPVDSGIVESLIQPEGHVTGVSLKISVEQQFIKLQETIPKVSKIGLLYDAKNMAQVRDEALQAAEKLGLTLIAKPIYFKAEVGKALNEVIKESDALWAGVDSLIYNSQSSQNILLSTLRNKIPFMAFSSNYVNAGALMALECDYVDIGRQSAEMASKILNGAHIQELPVRNPRTMRLVINEKTAELIGVVLKKKSLR